MSNQLSIKDYAFIVIGGGSAGCLLARLLAERDCGPVALLEAGHSSADIRTRVPAYYPRIFGSPFDWGFATEPQAGLNGRSIAWPRGKVLGGSGAINALIYLQAAEADFNRWLKSGCEGWRGQSVKTLECAMGVLGTACPFSGLSLGKLSEPHPWSEAFLSAAESWGLVRQDYWTQAATNTCGMYTLMLQHGQRAHTGQQLSEPHLANLDVFPDSTVTKLRLKSQKVIAVEFFDAHGNRVSIPVSGSVTLSAGTIGSCSILLRSGIGPSNHLQAAGINVNHELMGVGENLQDHLVYPLVFRASSAIGLPSRFSASHRLDFREHHRGPLASNIAEAGALFSIHDADAPEYQLHFTPTHYLKYPFTPTTQDHFSVALTHLHPRSRGSLRLRSCDPIEAPLIDPAYLCDTVDMDHMLTGVEACRELAQQPGLRGRIVDELIPGSKRVERASIERSIRAFAQSIYHPVGTCRMGTDAMAVVSPELQVHGIDNLHIADASVLPDLPSANTNAVTLLVAARAAQLLCPV